MALPNYQSAAVDLRKQLSHPLREEAQLPTLVSVIFLGFYEISAPDSVTQRQMETDQARFLGLEVLSLRSPILLQSRHSFRVCSLDLHCT